MPTKSHHTKSNTEKNEFYTFGGGPTLEGVANVIQHSHTKNIVILAGAGISTSAVPPIPDFRSKGTGLYDNLAKFKLPYAEAIFDIDYFQRNPQPFYTLAQQLYPGNFKPSLAYYFFKLLHDKQKLLRVFTQNVDTLERIAGLPSSAIVESHGSFATATCIKCQKPVDEVWMKETVMKAEIAKCPDAQCRKKFKRGALVKPDIIFFGEGLPARFFNRIRDLQQADLLIVLGTLLQVHPFASLIHQVSPTCPRVLINLQRVGEIGAYSSHSGMKGLMNESGFDFQGAAYGGQEYTRDVFWQGNADDGILLLAKHLGWEDELLSLRDQSYRKLDKQWGEPIVQEPKQSSDRSTPKTAETEANEMAEKASHPLDPIPFPLLKMNGEKATSLPDESNQPLPQTDDLVKALEAATLDDGEKS